VLTALAGLQGLYLLLVTNKQSNILEDLDTLRMLSKIVPEFAGSPDEDSICRAGFDLIFAFDEIIAQGHKENITVLQVKQNCEMESHEEKLHKMIIQSKINDTKDLMKRKAMEIDKTKMDTRKMGGGGDKGMGGFVPGGMGGFNAGASSAGSLRPAADDAAPSFSTPGSANTSGSGARPAGPKKGMQLGKAKGAASILETLAKEGEAVDLHPTSKASAGSAAAAAAVVEPVFISVDEKLTVLLNKEGGLENMEVQVGGGGRGAGAGGRGQGSGPGAGWGPGSGLSWRRAQARHGWAGCCGSQGGEPPAVCVEAAAAGGVHRGVVLAWHAAGWAALCCCGRRGCSSGGCPAMAHLATALIWLPHPAACLPACLQGTMSLVVKSEDDAYVKVAISSGPNKGFQFKTHPNIDKALYTADNLLALKDPSRPFPTGGLGGGLGRAGPGGGLLVQQLGTAAAGRRGSWPYRRWGAARRRRRRGGQQSSSRPAAAWRTALPVFITACLPGAASWRNPDRPAGARGALREARLAHTRAPPPLPSLPRCRQRAGHPQVAHADARREHGAAHHQLLALGVGRRVVRQHRVREQRRLRPAQRHRRHPSQPGAHRQPGGRRPASGMRCGCGDRPHLLPHPTLPHPGWPVREADSGRSSHRGLQAAPFAWPAQHASTLTGWAGLHRLPAHQQRLSPSPHLGTPPPPPRRRSTATGGTTAGRTRCCGPSS
jgi:hypothetical protein